MAALCTAFDILSVSGFSNKSPKSALQSYIQREKIKRKQFPFYFKYFVQNKLTICKISGNSMSNSSLNFGMDKST